MLKVIFRVQVFFKNRSNCRNARLAGSISIVALAQGNIRRVLFVSLQHFLNSEVVESINSLRS